MGEIIAACSTIPVFLIRAALFKWAEKDAEAAKDMLVKALYVFVLLAGSFAINRF